MNKLYNIVLFALLALLATACGAEDPFNPDTNETGSLSVKKMIVKIENEENVVRSAVDVGSFIVDICRADGSVADSYVYSSMPEVITLPVGSYTVKVRSGEVQPVAWETPYFEGSQEFEVKSREITEVSTVVCKLANVRVTILFDENLRQSMAPDAHVTVEMGNQTSIEFSRDETRSAYLAYVEGSNTLVATFSGNVGGGNFDEFKAYTDVRPGNHYKITYSFHSGGLPGDEGDMVFSGLFVDASVIEESLVINVDPGEDDIIDDNDRPKEDPEQGDTPITPPTPGKEGPMVIVPEGSDVSFDDVVNISDGAVYKVVVTSETGITSFLVDIDSEYLTEDFLSGVGLSTHLDLVNPGSLKEGIAGLSLPVEVGGMKEVEFDVSQLVPLLELDDVSRIHKFVITVADADGITIKTLQFRNLK